MRNLLKPSLVAVGALVVCGISSTAAHAAALGGDGLGGSVIGSGNSYGYSVNFATIALGNLLGLLS
ncbi:MULTISPECIES: hypothetical protein [Streptomyces]|uniref:hypothetical protein n=1 Tax=Streptomyces TaxID=1883 RepID=UPI000F7A93C6|nr:MULTISPECIES: hypothetical protein [Streptomyces]RST02039.1 hypothetical protein EF910_25875 [Streptomyces sp. WAC07149]GLX22866.1 hypothetical protein Slala01_65100 [Streptomyces lavendulae subsp. lavendulae]GLX24394.1 hypothetical protein Slala02_02140 [Streptomyces lavendulae subsp. lavendulae]